MEIRVYSGMKSLRTEMCPVCGGSSFSATKKEKCKACFGQGYQTWQLIEPEKQRKTDAVQRLISYTE